MKKIFILTLLIFVISCSSDNEEETIITVEDFNVTIDENPDINQLLGNINATTNQGSLSYSIISQSNNEALAINESSGELTVGDETIFDFETNPIITAIVEVTNDNISATSNVTITLNDIFNQNDFIIAGDTNPDNVVSYDITGFYFDCTFWCVYGELDIDNDGINDIRFYRDGLVLNNADNTFSINSINNSNVEFSYSISYGIQVDNAIQNYNDNIPLVGLCEPFPTGDYWINAYNIDESIDNTQDWHNSITAGAIWKREGCYNFTYNPIGNIYDNSNKFIGFRKTTSNGTIYGWVNNQITLYATNNITE